MNPHLQGYARFMGRQKPPTAKYGDHPTLPITGGVRRSAGRGPRDKPLTGCSRARVE
jgi:hypothetical protein